MFIFDSPMKATYQFEYEIHTSGESLSQDDAILLQAAKDITATAYAPYSGFHVGAAVRLHDGQIITGVNIENASYPVGICAERSALSAVISSFPSHTIDAIAISYFAAKSANNQPAFPCGMCRQFISECEDRNKKKIKLILGAQQGNIIAIETIKQLLPFGFSGGDLG